MANYKLSKLSFLLATSAPTKSPARASLLLILLFFHVHLFLLATITTELHKGLLVLRLRHASPIAPGDANKGTTVVVKEDVQ